MATASVVSADCGSLLDSLPGGAEGDSSLGWSLQRDSSAVSNASFGSASQRTALVHNPYTFGGPYEVVLLEEGGIGNSSFGPDDGSQSDLGLGSDWPACKDRMCNVAFGFHVSSCPLAHAPQPPSHWFLGGPDPVTVSPTSPSGVTLPDAATPTPTPASSPQVQAHARPRASLPIPASALNRHRKMLRALRQDSHQHLLQLQVCGAPAKGSATATPDDRSGRDV
eukprot:EG_transcript_2493